MKEVIILGCGPTHVECKFHCETWGVNGTYTFAKRIDKLFMTDEVEEVNAGWYDLPKMIESGAVLVTPVEYPKFKELGIQTEIYPIDVVMKRFQGTRFFSNSIAYMLAYALLHAPDDDYYKIHMFGIDMMTTSTYLQEKGGVEFWMGAALGMSAERVAHGKPPIEIINTRGSSTGKTWNGRMYGYYGKHEEQYEGLYAPWEYIRVSKTANPQEEWIKVGNEFRQVKTHSKAGEEVVTDKPDALVI